MSNILLDMITTSAILFLTSAGLLVVFGVMKIINFAHAAFITVGGSATFVAHQLGLPPILGPVFAFAVGALLGALAEFVIVRRLYARPLDAILATWGLGLILGQLVVLAFGRGVQFVPPPVQGTVAVIGTEYSLYRMLLILLAIAVAVGFTALLNGTRLGLSTRAVIMNEELAQGLGINSTRVRLITFAIGCGLAALAGSLLTPLTSVDPLMGLPYLIGAFMLVMVSSGSLPALAVACVVLGGLQAIISTYFGSVLGGLTIAVFAAIALRLRPEGFARA
jgi:branched-chain amino acid transport system permease protein